MSKQLLEEFVKDSFKGKNKITYTISERGNQRIEITDLKDGETWQTLEATSPPDNPEDYDEISSALLSGLVQQM